MRDGVMTIRKRDKLPDVEAKKNYFIPRKPTTFETAFPQIATMRLEVERGEGANRFSNPMVYTEESPPDRILPCDNPLCYRGGCDVQRFLSGVVAGHEVEVERMLFCQGYEGSPKGRKNYGPCDTRYKVKVKIAYKSAGEVTS
jgi:hypothetical protein